MDKLRSVKFLDYSNHTCVNHANQDFVTKFLSAVDSVSPIKTLRVKSNIRPWFDIDVLNAIQNRDKHYKKFKQSGRETDKDNFKYAKLSLKKIVDNKKKLYFEKTIAENKINPKELWRTLKSLGMLFKGGRQSKISLKENSSPCKYILQVFLKLFSLLLKLLRPKKNLESKPLENIISRFVISVRILLYTMYI